MEFDLARLRDINQADQFVSRLRQVCDITLTNDFWSVTLPNDLATSSPRSPSLLAYNAALVLLDARVLFSGVKLADLMDPAIHAGHSLIERHHLFPKGYLKTQMISGTREINQIANYAYVEGADNMKISDRPPLEYTPQLKARFSQVELTRMYRCHALPENWERMEYQTFLKERRGLMAQIIFEGYRALMYGLKSPVSQSEEFDLGMILDGGESEAVEFKSTLRINLHTDREDKRMELAVLKTLAGFLNTNGGTLIVGVSDDGAPVGVEADKFSSEDKMSLHLVNIVKARMGAQAMIPLHMRFEDHEGRRVLAVRCMQSPVPVFVKDGEIERFYIRTGPATTELSAGQTQAFIKQRFK